MQCHGGAPTSGTWSTGQSYVDGNGALWVCTVGGTPGTWAQVTANAELGYFTDTTNHSGLAATSFSAIPGFTKTVTVLNNGRPLYVDASIPFAAIGATAGAVYFAIYEDGMACTPEGTTVLTAAAHEAFSVRWRCRRTPSPGIHTYAVYYAVSSTSMSLSITNNFAGQSASSIAISQQ
jgi:hypothetical protein